MSGRLDDLAVWLFCDLRTLDSFVLLDDLVVLLALGEKGLPLSIPSG